MKRRLLLGLLSIFLASCASVTPTVQEPSAIKLVTRVKFGYLDFIPLPHNYPSGYLPHERVFTGEVYAQDPTSSLPASDLRFVPKDYRQILESAFSQGLKTSGLTPSKYSSIREARLAGCDLLVQGVPLAFHVEDESKAVVTVYYKVFTPNDRRTVWEGQIDTEFAHTGVPRSITGRVLVFLVGSHEFNFQPQRALLAVAAYNNALDFLNTLATVTQGPK